MKGISFEFFNFLKANLVMTRENYKKYDLNAAAKKIQAIYRGFAMRRLISLSFAKFMRLCDEVESQIHVDPSVQYSFVNGVDYVNL